MDAGYDEMDIEMVVLRGYEEDEDIEVADSAFIRGYLGMGEA
jgi:hypothetical protein